ncbi:MAG: hypothetical protein R3F02_18520 [Thiolinea sp.]
MSQRNDTAKGRFITGGTIFILIIIVTGMAAGAIHQINENLPALESINWQQIGEHNND